jgi:3-oxoacyl-[acyl-carrier protein] reductase
LITGAMSDIGRAAAWAFARRGYNIIVNYRNRAEDALGFAEQLVQTGGAPQAQAVAADVRHRADVQSLFDQAYQKMGGVDVLINNAGINRDRPFVEMSHEEWDTVTATILNGSFYCAQEFVRRYTGESGCILNMGSISALKGRKNGANYCSARAAVLTLTKCLALELAPRIRVNSVTPGRIDTEELRTRYTLNDPQNRSRSEQEVPLKRLGRPDDVASAMVFLVANGNYITGQNLIVDGGLCMA